MCIAVYFEGLTPIPCLEDKKEVVSPRPRFKEVRAPGGKDSKGREAVYNLAFSYMFRSSVATGQLGQMSCLSDGG